MNTITSESASKRKSYDIASKELSTPSITELNTTLSEQIKPNITVLLLMLMVILVTLTRLYQYSNIFNYFIVLLLCVMELS